VCILSFTVFQILECKTSELTTTCVYVLALYDEKCPENLQYLGSETSEFYSGTPVIYVVWTHDLCTQATLSTFSSCSANMEIEAVTSHLHCVTLDTMTMLQ
jgi:hypothetical protein